MSSLGTSKGFLEITKFGIFVTVPILFMFTFANNNNHLRKFMGMQLEELLKKTQENLLECIQRAVPDKKLILTLCTKLCSNIYSVYKGNNNNPAETNFWCPPEGPKPPSPEELREVACKLALNKDIH